MQKDHASLGSNARDDPAGFVTMHAAGIVSLVLVVPPPSPSPPPAKSSRLAAKYYSPTTYLIRMIQLTISHLHRPQDD